MNGRIERGTWLAGAAALAVAVVIGAALWAVSPSRAADDLPPPPPAADPSWTDTPVTPVLESDPLSDEPNTSGEPAVGSSLPPGRFVAEVIDSTYFVEPAYLFALDLPVRASGGARAVHILGDVSVVGGRRDLIVRLFRASDYLNWLKRRGGRQAGPLWSSNRQRTIHLDQDLPIGVPVVLLLDNGYSLRTPKRVRVQVQLQYQGEGAAQSISAQQHPTEEGDIVPRSNADEEVPPPPPPAGGGSN